MAVRVFRLEIRPIIKHHDERAMRKLSMNFYLPCRKNNFSCFFVLIFFFLLYQRAIIEKFSYLRSFSWRTFSYFEWRESRESLNLKSAVLMTLSFHSLGFLLVQNELWEGNSLLLITICPMTTFHEKEIYVAKENEEMLLISNINNSVVYCAQIRINYTAAILKMTGNTCM